MLEKLAIVPLCALAVLTGCESSHPRGGGGPVPIDRFDDELIAGACDRLFACSGSGDIFEARLLFGTEARCIEWAGRAISEQADVADLQRQVAAGTVLYDAEAARRCIDEALSSCGAFFGSGNPYETCIDVFTGTVALGGSCWRGEECVGDSYCDHGTMETCPGTCAARKPLGSACSSGSECAREGLTGGPDCWWDEMASASRCVDRIRQSGATSSQPCGLVSAAGNVLTERDCVVGLACTGDSDTMGACISPVPVGSACSSGGVPCADASFCVVGTCVAITIRHNVGEACGEAELALCDPLSNLECGPAGTCQSIGDGSMGSPCNSGDFTEFACDPGLRCLRDTNTCGPPRAAGATCESSSECASGDCDPYMNTCRARYCGA